MLTLSPLAVIHPAEVAPGVVHPVHESEPRWLVFSDELWEFCALR